MIMLLPTHYKGIRYLKSKLPELQNNTKSLPENVMHNLLYFLKTHEVFATQKPYLLKALQKLQPSNSIALSPLTAQTNEDLVACDFKRYYFLYPNLPICCFITNIISEISLQSKHTLLR